MQYNNSANFRLRDLVKA